MFLLKEFLENRLGLSYSGEFSSNQTWSGYDIEDFRDYQPGDNVKHINWKLSAKYDKEFVNIYRAEKESVIDIYLDNNLNFQFFLPLFESFKRYLLEFKYELDFKFRVFTFDKNTIKLAWKNFFPEITFNRTNNLNLLFSFYEFQNKNPKILVSDLLFLEDTNFPVNKMFFWLFPIKDLGQSYPVLNGYCGFCDDFWQEYEEKIKKLQRIGVVEFMKYYKPENKDK